MTTWRANTYFFNSLLGLKKVSLQTILKLLLAESPLKGINQLPLFIEMGGGKRIKPVLPLDLTAGPRDVQ
jgi:hypothetical protein